MMEEKELTFIETLEKDGVYVSTSDKDYQHEVKQGGILTFTFCGFHQNGITAERINVFKYIKAEDITTTPPP